MAEYDSEAMEDERAIELSTIAAIYPEMVLDPDSSYHATLHIPISPSVPLTVRFKQSAEIPSINQLIPPVSGNVEQDPKFTAVKDRHGKSELELPQGVHRLYHLPPISLKIFLPQGYPSQSPAVFRLSPILPWIPTDTIERLTDDGTRLWEEQGRSQIVFTYIDHLQQCADAGFSQTLNGEHELILATDLEIALLDFDLKAKRQIFEKETFDCGICLEPKKGAACYRFILCSHVFCVDCLRECFGKCIIDGDVDNVKCLEPGCEKARRAAHVENIANMAPTLAIKRRKLDLTLNPNELLQIPLSVEQVQRYVHLKRKKKLESDKNTVYCPRPWCQGAARSKKYPKPTGPLHDVEEVLSDSDTQVQDATQASIPPPNRETLPMAERLCICEDCNYAFCVVCCRGWHGAMISYRQCNPREKQELTEEEKASAEYIALHSTACPTCGAPCQKTMGCNHMICFKCRSHFCYLCSSYLMEDNPYDHFNDKANPCYRRLWELEAGDDADAQIEVLDLPYLNREVNFDSDSDSDTDSDFDSSDDEVEIFRRVALPVRGGRGRVGQPVRGRGRGGAQGARGAPHQGPPRHARGRGGGRGGARAAGRGVGRGARAANPPPPAPNPPVAEQQPEDHALRNPNADDGSDSDSTEDEVPIRFVRHEAGQRHDPGNNRDGDADPAQEGIDRFLQLVERDQEDEWDSDELEDQFEDIDLEERRRARPRVMGRRV